MNTRTDIASPTVWTFYRPTPLRLILLSIAACAAPFLVHLIPWHGAVPLGAHLLPMFLVTFFAAALHGPLIGVCIALCAPALNLALTGFPASPFLTAITCELVVFSLLVPALLRLRKNFWLAAAVAYAGASVVSTGFFGEWTRLPSQMLQASVGLVLLTVFNFLLVRVRKNDVGAT